MIAEIWEVSDQDDEPAVVLNGAHRGRRLRELVAAFPGEVVRPGWSGPHLPLLVKFLDASHRLPVHLHPDDAAARARYGARNALSGVATVAPVEGGFVTLTNLGGALDVEYEAGVVTLPRAASCLLPAALGEVRLRPRAHGDLVACFEPGGGTWRG